MAQNVVSRKVQRFRKLLSSRRKWAKNPLLLSTQSFRQRKQSDELQLAIN